MVVVRLQARGRDGDHGHRLMTAVTTIVVQTDVRSVHSLSLCVCMSLYFLYFFLLLLCSRVCANW